MSYTYWSRGACNCHIRRASWERLDCPVHDYSTYHTSPAGWVTRNRVSFCEGRHCNHRHDGAFLAKHNFGEV